MRLIDKDALLELVEDLELEYEDKLKLDDSKLYNPKKFRVEMSASLSAISGVYRDIYGMPEISSIPIEWLLNHQRVDGQDNILELVKLWEKENDNLLD